MSPLDLLNSGNFQVYNRKVAQMLGSVNAAIMLSELVNRYQYHEERKELKTLQKHEGTWFYYEVNKCTERTVLSKKEQSSALNVLSRYNLFEKKGIGIPCKRHFKLDIPAIMEFISNSNKVYSCAKREQLDVPKGNNSMCRKGTTIKEPYKEPQEEPKLNKNNVRGNPVLPPNVRGNPVLPPNVRGNPVLPPKEGKEKKPIKPETLISSLSQEQKEAYEKIMSYKPQWGDPPKTEDVCAWMLSLNHTPARIVESLKIYEQDCEDAVKRGDSIRCMGASIRAILNNPDRKLRNVDYDLNKKFAEQKAQLHKFLEIKKDYVKIRVGRKEEEINFNLPHISFFQTLEGLIKDSFYHLENE